MKIEFPKLKKKQNFRKGGFHTNPNIGWEVLVFLATTAVLGSFIYGFLLYQKTSVALETSLLPSENRQKIVDKSRVEKVIMYFREKESRTEQIVAGPARVVDPSR